MTSSAPRGTRLPRERWAIAACDLRVPLAARGWDDVLYVAFVAASMASQADRWAGDLSRALLEARMVAGRAAAAAKRSIFYDELDAALVLARPTRPPMDHCELIDQSVAVAWEMARHAVGAQDDPAGSDLAVAVRMIERYGAEGVIGAIDSTVSERAAQLVVSTAHKAKGLEWATVRIADDFTEPRDKKTGELLPIPRADAMLGYVAIT